MIAREGYTNIAGAIIVAIILYGASAFVGFIPSWLAFVLSVLATCLILFMLFFFRDPERRLPDDEDLIVAPADGKIVYLQQVDEPHYIKGKATQISIFLSLADVHVNRLPASGKIEYLKYNPGVYLMAFDDRSSSMNERADFGLRHASGTKIFFRQITGFLARRIVYHLKRGDHVTAGERFGMMKFGSRMDILLPPEIDLKVKKGDKTVGGETVLAKIETT